MRFVVAVFSRIRLVGLLGSLVLLLVLTSATFGQGTVTRMTIKSNVLGEDRVILVRTPVGYENNKVSYPVLYMTDGDAHMAHTASTVEFLARNGRTSELIVVGITNTDRTRDLTPTKASRVDLAGAPTAGGADNFLKFIETELIPDIEKRYRVQPYRILAGHSLGGLFTVHVMITRPDLFGSYVAVSPSLQWADEATLKKAEEFLKTRKELNATLFTSLGNEPGDIGDSFDLFKQALANSQIKNFEWQAEQLKDEDHGSVVLRSHYLGLRKVFDGWQMPRDSQTGTVVGGMKGVDEHYQKLSQRFGYAIPVPEGLINQVGYQYLFGGKSDEAIATFKLNVDRYPNSANVYDSLAEAYERGGRLDLATPLYEKASIVGKQNNDPNAGLFAQNYARASEKLKQSDAAAKKNQ
jgi:uncharacterized protein